MKLYEEAKNEEPNETKYITENMGELTIKNNEFKYVYGKYNSEEIQIANMGLVSSKFKENFDYIINVINQYEKIHEISKKAILINFKNDTHIRRFFEPYNSLEGDELFELIKKFRNDVSINTFIHFCNLCTSLEELFKLFDINIFEGFDINKAVDKLKYPRLYFADNSSGRYGDEEIYFKIQYRMSDDTDESDLILEVFMDSKLKIYCFDCCRPITIDLK